MAVTGILECPEYLPNILECPGYPEYPRGLIGDPGPISPGPIIPECIGDPGPISPELISPGCGPFICIWLGLINGGPNTKGAKLMTR